MGRNATIDGVSRVLVGENSIDLANYDQGQVCFDFLVPNILPQHNSPPPGSLFNKYLLQLQEEFNYKPKHLLMSLHDLVHTHSFTAKQVAQLMSIPAEHDEMRTAIAAITWPHVCDPENAHHISWAGGPRLLASI